MSDVDVSEPRGWATLDRRSGAAEKAAAEAEQRRVTALFGRVGAKITIGEDKARQYGGKEKYFADRTGPVLKKTGMNTERVIVYDNLRQYAIDQFRAGKTTRTIYDAGGTGSTNYSIVAVRFEEGVCSGLYNPKGFGSGTMFDTQPLNGGTLHDIGSGVLGTGFA